MTPTAAELAKAETPLDYGRLYGYSEDDIAHFYNRRRRGHQSGYEEYVRDLENPAFPVGYKSSGGPGDCAQMQCTARVVGEDDGD